MSSRDLQALMLDQYIDQMQMHGAGSAAPQPAIASSTRSAK
jgi:hypothetical protein